MGLHVQSLSNLPLTSERDYYIYLLDYGWHEPLGEALMDNFDKMAAIASENNAVVIRGTKRVHFEDEVLSWHNVNGENPEEILPAILITNRHPAHFKDSPNRAARQRIEDDLKMILIPLKKTCKTTSDVVALVEKLFSDIIQKKDLSDFRIQKELKRGVGSALADALILEPNWNGIGFDFKKFFSYLSNK